MSKDVREFAKLVGNDAELQNRIAAAAEQYEGEHTDQAVFQAILDPIAKEQGFDLSWEDLEQYAQELLSNEIELDEDELDQIAAGAQDPNPNKDPNQKNERGGVGITSCIKVGVGVGTTLHEDGNRTYCIFIGGGKTSGIGICLSKGWGC